jgi:hypothetical protein
VPDGRGARDVVVGVATVVTGIVVVGTEVAALSFLGVDVVGAICEETVTCEDEVPHAVMPVAMTAAAVHPTRWQIVVRRMCEVVMSIMVSRSADGRLTIA